MNSFTASRAWKIKREITDLAGDKFEDPGELIVALNDIHDHIGHVMPAPPPPQLIASWPIENQDDDGTSYGIQGSDTGPGGITMEAVFQAIQLPQGGKLASIKLYLNPRSSSPTFDMVVSLFATTGGANAKVPTGNALATSDVINAASLIDPGALTEFLFSGANQVDLQAGQFYAFVFGCSGAYPPSSQRVYCGLNWAVSPPGNGGYNQGGVYSPDPSCTLTFYLYAQ